MLTAGDIAFWQPLAAFGVLLVIFFYFAFPGVRSPRRSPSRWLPDRSPEAGRHGGLPAALPGAVFCGHCWEPIVHDGAIWRHVRTWKPAMWNDKQCAPLCDWPGCGCEADAGRSLGKDTWTGSVFRWHASHFLCHEHWAAYRREQLVIDRT